MNDENVIRLKERLTELEYKAEALAERIRVGSSKISQAQSEGKDTSSWEKFLTQLVSSYNELQVEIRVLRLQLNPFPEIATGSVSLDLQQPETEDVQQELEETSHKILLGEGIDRFKDSKSIPDYSILEFLGVSEKEYSRLRQHEVEWPFDNAEAIAEKLNLTNSYFVEAFLDELRYDYICPSCGKLQPRVLQLGQVCDVCKTLNLDAKYPTTKTKQLAEQLLQKLKSDPRHILSRKDRVELYKSFGVTFYYEEDDEEMIDYGKIDYRELCRTKFLAKELADYVLGWLAILTAEHVTTIWDLYLVQSPFGERDYTAQYLLNVARDALIEQESFDEALAILLDANAAQTIYMWVTCDVNHAFNAAYYALELILIGTDDVKGNKLGIESDADDPMAESRDFADTAVRAYTAIDANEPGTWFLLDENVVPVIFDWKKRLEFWEWWLTEAIPQAWQLAQENYQGLDLEES